MNASPRPVECAHGGWSVNLIGLGNVGAPLARHLVAMPGIARLAIFDDDVYETSNLHGQLITPQDVGTPKAKALARQLRRLNPAVRIDAHVKRIEEVPLGELRMAGLTVCGVDSRESRQHSNRVCRRAGMPLVDVAVQAGGSLVRVATYLAGEGSCLECQWGPEEYARLVQRHPCQKAAPAPSTRGDSATGAIAAALAAMEVGKFVNGNKRELPGARQLFLDPRHHQLDVVRFEANAACLRDHAPWRIETLDVCAKELRLGDALALSGDRHGSTMRLDGHVFVRRLHCVRCARRGKSMLRLSRRLRSSQRTCRRCGGRLAATAFDVTGALSVDNVTDARLARPLHDFGFLDRDVFTLLHPQEQPAHFQIGGEVNA